MVSIIFFIIVFISVSVIIQICTEPFDRRPCSYCTSILDADTSWFYKFIYVPIIVACIWPGHVAVHSFVEKSDTIGLKLSYSVTLKDHIQVSGHTKISEGISNIFPIILPHKITTITNSIYSFIVCADTKYRTHLLFDSKSTTIDDSFVAMIIRIPLHEQMFW